MNTQVSSILLKKNPKSSFKRDDKSKPAEFDSNYTNLLPCKLSELNQA